MQMMKNISLSKSIYSPFTVDDKTISLFLYLTQNCYSFIGTSNKQWRQVDYVPYDNATTFDTR